MSEKENGWDIRTMIRVCEAAKRYMATIPEDLHIWVDPENPQCAAEFVNLRAAVKLLEFWSSMEEE